MERALPEDAAPVRVLDLHLALFLDVEAEVFQQDDFAGLEAGAGGLDDCVGALPSNVVSCAVGCVWKLVFGVKSFAKCWARSMKYKARPYLIAPSPFRSAERSFSILLRALPANSCKNIPCMRRY